MKVGATWELTTELLCTGTRCYRWAVMKGGEEVARGATSRGESMAKLIGAAVMAALMTLASSRQRLWR